MRLVFLVFVTAAFAQRVSTDQFWAQRSGLPVSDVAAIRKLADVPENRTSSSTSWTPAPSSGKSMCSWWKPAEGIA
jgi:hypothetical protein